jgi:hypothetical protein
MARTRLVMAMRAMRINGTALFAAVLAIAGLIAAPPYPHSAARWALIAAVAVIGGAGTYWITRRDLERPPEDT